MCRYAYQVFVTINYFFLFFNKVLTLGINLVGIFYKHHPHVFFSPFGDWIQYLPVAQQPIAMPLFKWMASYQISFKLQI